MGANLLFPIVSGESGRFAACFLRQYGFQLTDHPSPDITHLLLDVPGSPSDTVELKELLRRLPKNITVIGGNLELDFFQNYKKMDLLKDPLFLAKNAAITAECALQAAAPYLTTTFADTPVLILGWGRIGKCLGKLLSVIGCPVTIAARKDGDRALAEAMGHRAVDFSTLEHEISRHKLLFNTVPDGIVSDKQFEGCILMDLASAPGLKGRHIITARGLPGKYAPESAGRLIAESICRLDKEVIT